MNKVFSFRDISKYRAELMGIAIIGVLIGHIFAFGEYPLHPILDNIIHGIHTQGFLFLSGFGLYYSLSKNHEAKQFYIRRFYRFFLPFLVIAIPFFTVVCITQHLGLLQFLSCISTVRFWISGNYDGMWYISLSLVLYAITPFTYYWVTRREKYTLPKFLFFIACAIIINILIQSISAEYWEKVSIGLKHSQMFFWGMLIAYIASNLNCNDKRLWIYGMISIALYFFLSITYNGGGYYFLHILQLFFYVILFCICFGLIGRVMSKSITLKTLRWFGKYTLELYLLHLYLYEIFISNYFHLSQSYGIIIAVCASIVLCVPVHKITKYITAKLQK